VSTSVLYSAMGIHGYRHCRARSEGGVAVFSISQKRHELRCPRCGSWNLIRRGTVQRRFRALPIGDMPVWIELPVQRVYCVKCKVVQQVRVQFAARRRSYTKSFERYAARLCRMGTIQDVAWHLGVSWDVVKDIDKRYLGRRFGRPKLGHLKVIAIDELCIGKGRYLTLVLNLKSGEVVFVGQGKGKEALLPFWKRLARHKAVIRAVAIDMSKAYLSAVWEHLPGAAVVFDRFHVIKLYNEKLTQLRRQVQNAAEALGKEVLKGTRWLLLKNPENLDPRKKEHERLQEALRLNQPLATAYYLKDDLRRFWEQDDKAKAKRFIDDWIARATATGITVLKKFAQTMHAYRFGLVAWYDHPISTGPLEGTNNKIKTLQRQAYGYRDQDYFTLRIYGLHQTKYALVG
jgi:transposase